MANDVDIAADIIQFIEDTPGFPGDVQRIQELVKDRCGLDLGKLQAELLWSKISDYVAATWLILPESDDELWEDILTFVRLYKDDQ